MGFSLLPREDEYFTFFTQMGAKIEEASDLLVEMLEHDTAEHEAFNKRIKDVEHQCDEITHNITTKLNKSFITPFDREDIYHLSVALDDICDYIDAGARAIVIYDIPQPNKHTKDLAKVIQQLSVQIKNAVSMLKKPDSINTHFVEIHRLENEADEIYFRAMKELFKDGIDPITIIKWKEVYEILEYATDRCESVANIIESIVLKHN
jgi:predicted phosphate transport protein (TIGR00153 family)